MSGRLEYGFAVSRPLAVPWLPLPVPVPGLPLPGLGLGLGDGLGLPVRHWPSGAGSQRDSPDGSELVAGLSAASRYPSAFRGLASPHPGPDLHGIVAHANGQDHFRRQGAVKRFLPDCWWSCQGTRDWLAIMPGRRLGREGPGAARQQGRRRSGGGLPPGAVIMEPGSVSVQGAARPCGTPWTLPVPGSVRRLPGGCPGTGC